MKSETLIKEIKSQINDRILSGIGNVYGCIRDVLMEFEFVGRILNFRVTVKDNIIQYYFRDINGVKYIFTGEIVSNIVYWDKAETPFVIRRDYTYPLKSSDNVFLEYDIGYEVEYIEVSFSSSRVKLKNYDHPVNSLYFFESMDDIGSFLGIYNSFIDIGTYVL